MAVTGKIVGTQIVASRCVVTLEKTGVNGTETQVLSFKAGTDPQVALGVVKAEIDDANQSEKLAQLQAMFEACQLNGTVFGEPAATADVPK